MTTEQLKTALAGEQKTFAELAQQPNTLQRNVTLAEHRAEISRLEKLIVRSAKTAAVVAA